jgi:hypothetical protein
MAAEEAISIHLGFSEIYRSERHRTTTRKPLRAHGSGTAVPQQEVSDDRGREWQGHVAHTAGLEPDIRRCVRGHLGRRLRRAEPDPVLPRA